MIGNIYERFVKNTIKCLGSLIIKQTWYSGSEDGGKLYAQ